MLFFVRLSLTHLFLTLAILISNPVLALENIVLQLKWSHQFQFAGYYAAKEQGYYAEAGFDVTILPLDQSTTPTDAVLNGQADYGIIGSSIILDRMRGIPLVAVAAVFQHSPLVLITRTDDQLLGPYELKNKRIMYRKGYDDATLIAMFTQLNINESDYQHVPHSFDPNALATGEVDAISGYLTDQPFYYQKAGVNIQVINPMNYGIDFYDDILFTSEELIHRDPDRVNQFVKASMKGWKYALAHKAELIELIQTKYDSNKPLANLKFEAEQTEKMILPNLVDIGHISSSRFRRIADIYKQLGFVPLDATFEGVDFKDYLVKEKHSPFEMKILLALVGGSLLLVIVLFYLNRRLNHMVSDRTQGLMQVKENLARYIDIVDRYVISSQTDLDGKITDVSTAFCRVSGYSKEELLGQTHKLLKHPETNESIYKEMWDTITQGNTWSGELLNQAKDGSRYWVDAKIDPVRNEEGKICGYISIRHNITDKKRVEELSITDKLTGLNNRLRLDDIMLEEISRMKRYSLTLSIILVDIDFFKIVNDNFGHLVGDQVLIEIAQILRINCRGVDVVGRWGGEEFLIICPETSIEEAISAANKFRTIIAQHDFPEVGNKTASFGVTTGIPSDSVADILRRADKALYRAKDQGRNRVEFLLGKSSDNLQ
ncbi:ABC transporter substrate-binding protein [Colwellia sp. KU-HH00111]|uniref:ABC transporter substrate-binding protein n=1 Tax=Colwellia sp. KU-HH00111 TaxID=3127652 RepID=UPI003103A5C3